MTAGSIEIDRKDIRKSSPWRSCAARSALYRKRACCSPVRLLRTCVSAMTKRPTKKSAARLRSRRQRILSKKKEEKYDSPIAQGGSNASGGQKQRLAIARTIAKSEDFIFDDSFSALDMKTDARRCARRCMKRQGQHDHSCGAANQYDPACRADFGAG